MKKLPPHGEIRLEMLVDRVKKIEASPKYNELNLSRLMEWASIKAGRPSRISAMSITEERYGWEVTMRSWDRAVRLGGLGTAKDLRGVVALPEQFINNRKNIALAFTDQVPVWVKAPKKRKICFAGYEKAQNTKKSKKFKDGER